MAALSRELLFLVIQFLKEEKFEEALHRLEKETGFYFNLKYFEEKALAGEWKEAESYLLGFTKVEDNRYSMKIFFELRKQKYLEALDRQDKQKAMQILVKELKVFSVFNEDLYKELTQLLTLDDFRENEQLSRYGNTQVARTLMVIELKKLIEANPLFHDKLAFPSLKPSRLRTLINQSLNWQHQVCKNPRPNPDIKSLFTDHSCTPQNGSFDPALLNLAAAYPSHGASGPLPVPAAAANANALAGWMAHSVPSAGQAALVTASSFPFPQNQVPIVKRPRTPPETPVVVGYQSADREQQMKRVRASEEVTYPVSRQRASWSVDDLPRTVAFTLRHGYPITSIDFHPSHHTLLLVGSNNGEITLWELRLRERLVSEPFKIWDMANSLQVQAAIAKDKLISVSCLTWSPDGTFVGVAFTKDLIHLYSYSESHNLHPLLEINAHNGPVNDLAFANPNKQLSVVTCGDDKLIKVWDLTGRKLYNFEGHEAPVYSVCPHKKENIQFIFSTDVNGKIKAWLYDDDGSRVDYNAPGKWCKMIYSADGSRLFSCGTSKEGEPFLVEWNESEGSIKRTYSGLRKKASSAVQFDTTKNRFLAVGEDRQIKFWDMDNNNVLTSTDAAGDLPSLPRLRFNREGSLLAVTTSDNGLKILANAVGVNSLKVIESITSFEGLRSAIESSALKASGLSTVTNVSAINCKVETCSPVRSTQNLFGVDQSNRSVDKSKPWQLTEVRDPAQCRLVNLPNTADACDKVVRLLYTNAGSGILALGSNGVQKLWKWIRNEQNPSGKATASVAPQDWQPNSGLRMNIDISGVDLEEATPCMALSKNDSYVMSACGGKISLFNMMTFKVMTTFMEPPPAPTYLAFHPEDNNVLAIGMEDSTIRIYNVRVDEVKPILKGHQKRITGVAFSNKLKILVSSSVDAQLCVWSIDTWEKKKSIGLPMPSAKAYVGDTRVQFHSDQIRFLVVHETQLAMYDASKMDCIRQWTPQDALRAPITYATYSCNSQLVYATFFDGNIGVFDADSLKLRCRIAPSTYLSQSVQNRSEDLCPLSVAVHPQDPNQFAVGFADGSVKVIEPKESEGTWGAAPPVENGISNGRTSSSSTTS